MKQNTGEKTYHHILPHLESLEESYYDNALPFEMNRRSVLKNLRSFADSLSSDQEGDERQRLLIKQINYVNDLRFNTDAYDLFLHILVLQALNLGKDRILEEVLG
ncbi:MAG: hypothetical protein LUQ69_09450 [Methanoregulaceae archaeon]|nr:hypothetical protein [Methanoregulaceae archaeon]